MLGKLFKHSFRALNRNKSYVFLNITGLSIGLACSLLIASFIIEELSYDKFYKNSKEIYRVILDGKIGEQQILSAYTCAPLGPTLINELPEVADFCRIEFWSEVIIKNNEKSFAVSRFMEADSSFFNIFSIKLINGDKNRVLSEPHTLVLTQSEAHRIFGDEDPVNSLLKVGRDSTLYRVTGIMEDFPENSHIQADMIGSFMTNPRSNDPTWLSNSFFTYVLLKPHSNIEDSNQKLNSILRKYIAPEVHRYIGVSLEDFYEKGNRYSMFLQPLLKIHVEPEIEGGQKSPVNTKYLWIFGCVAMLIIIIASINFMNLSTAQASQRAKEVGIKKVSGSSKSLLVTQFILESVILSFISLIISLVLVYLLLPYFNELLATHLQFIIFKAWWIIPALFILTILVGFISGSYPAFFLSSFQVVNVLKGKIRNNNKTGRLRSVLVVLQFSISMILIIATLIMYRQMNFMLNKDLGFDKENLMIIERGGSIGNHVNAFKSDILDINGVLSVASSTAIPGHNNNNNGYMIKGRTEESFLMQTNWVDYDYFKTYGIKLNSGRFFSPDFSLDKDACIINLSAVKQFGLSNPLSEIVLPPTDSVVPIESNIIGVADDFNFESLHSAIGPYIFRFKNDSINWGYFSLRLKPVHLKSTIEEIEKTWKSYSDNEPMKYYFMDEDFNRMYYQEKQSSRLSMVFSVLAVIIASLGLFGLTSYTINQRTKEIGIRKTMGSSTMEIFILISREIIFLVFISALIAWPVTYYAGDKWIQSFYYRINISIWDFLAGLIIALIIAVATITYQALSIAGTNPANSLRYE
ncbi:MAG: ABC transporter permease [Bacteroidales bacterium]|nr:ABC transporter permease [Bacteroidales bacterium]MCB9013846.1 ABC transporter permease [Bacteroidales bacterium]